MASKKSKKNENKGAEESPENGPKPVSADPQKSHEMYESKLIELEEKLDRAKGKAKALQAENECLLKIQTRSVAEKQDIIEFLRIELGNHEALVRETEQKLALHQQQLQLQTQAHMDEMQALEQKSHQDKLLLDTQVAQLKSELHELTEFQANKQMLESQLQSLVAQLSSKDVTYKTEISDLERKSVLDKQVHKRELMEKLLDAVGSFRRISEVQLAETTKRAMRENLLMSTQLSKFETQISDLIVENKKLAGLNSNLRIDLEIAKQSQRGLATKNVKAYQLIRFLLDTLEDANISAADLDFSAAVKSSTLHTRNPDTRRIHNLMRTKHMRNGHSTSGQGLPGPTSFIHKEPYVAKQRKIAKRAHLEHQVHLLSNLLNDLATELHELPVYKNPNGSSVISHAQHRTLSSPVFKDRVDSGHIVHPVVHAFIEDLHTQRVLVHPTFEQPQVITPSPQKYARANLVRDRLLIRNPACNSHNVTIDVILPHLLP